MSIFKDLKNELLLREEQEADAKAAEDMFDNDELEEDIVLGEEVMNIPEYDETNDTYNYNESVESLLSEEDTEEPVINSDPGETIEEGCEGKDCDNLDEEGIDDGIIDGMFDEDGDLEIDDTDDEDIENESALLNYLESVDPEDGEEIDIDEEDIDFDDEDDDFEFECGDLSEDGELSIQADDLDDDPIPDDCDSNTALKASKEGAVTDDDLTLDEDFEFLTEDEDIDEEEKDDDSDDDESDDDKDSKDDDEKESKEKSDDEEKDDDSDDDESDDDDLEGDED